LSTPAVRARGLARRFGRLEAVRGIDFDVARGEMFGLIGPDGAGKTTTLRMVLGLLTPTAGTVETCGLEPARRRRALSSRIGYLSQRFSLYGDLSVDENIAFFASVHGVRDWRERRDALLEDLRLTPFRDRLADRLSGGMRQKLALACTLIHTPELLVLDEPTTGVDPVSRRDFWRILTGLQRRGLTLLLTTPYLDEAERCARVALMSAGRLLTIDDPARLRAGIAHAMIEILAVPRAHAAAAARAVPGVSEVEAFGERLHVSVQAPRSRGAQEARRIAEALGAQGLEVRAARPIEPTLEDVFIARVRAERGAAPSPTEVTP
jgi:ABC-2 type transport system ATP-binding protein